MKRDAELRDALQHAVEQLRPLRTSASELFGDWSLPAEEMTLSMARAVGLIEGAAVALACTPLELLEEYCLTF